jgi:hypothetical protein
MTPHRRDDHGNHAPFLLGNGKDTRSPANQNALDDPHQDWRALHFEIRREQGRGENLPSSAGARSNKADAARSVPLVKMKVRRAVGYRLAKDRLAVHQSRPISRASVAPFREEYCGTSGRSSLHDH